MLSMVIPQRLAALSKGCDMKLDIARGLFLIGALGVASLAAAAWHEPGPAVFSSQVAGKLAKQECSMPKNVKAKLSAVRPDQDLLLLMFGLAQGGTR